MAINQHYKAIAELFEIEGYRNGYWEKFIHGRNFEAFLIKSNVKNL
jgi:hypothetical protein